MPEISACMCGCSCLSMQLGLCIRGNKCYLLNILDEQELNRTVSVAIVQLLVLRRTALGAIVRLRVLRFSPPAIIWVPRDRVSEPWPPRRPHRTKPSGLASGWILHRRRIFSVHYATRRASIDRRRYPALFFPRLAIRPLLERLVSMSLAGVGH